MELVGATAIEDKLQVDVGINFAGDKLLTLTRNNYKQTEGSGY